MSRFYDELDKREASARASRIAARPADLHEYQGCYKDALSELRDVIGKIEVEADHTNKACLEARAEKLIVQLHSSIIGRRKRPGAKGLVRNPAGLRSREKPDEQGQGVSLEHARSFEMNFAPPAKDEPIGKEAMTALINDARQFIATSKHAETCKCLICKPPK